MTSKAKYDADIDETKQPKAVPYILFNVFTERFSSAGILAILALFFHEKLGFDHNMSTALYHTYELFAYFFTLVGAILAESWFGIFNTIVAVNLLYVVGSVTVAVAGIEAINPPIEILVIIGLLLTVISSGSLKSNLNAFAGNQFNLPKQSVQLSYFFSIQYFAIKCGSTVARVMFPIMREDVKCLGMQDCYPLTFLLPAAAMLTSFLVLLCGKRIYAPETTSGNMLIRVIGCIVSAVKHKFLCRASEKKSHWLDYASDKYDRQLVTDTKTVLNLLIMYLPLPLIHALHSQQGSRWVFQATKLNGDIGFYKIKPDQMIFFNSILGVVLIPIFERFLYPALAYIGIKSHLQKITLGGVLSATSFVLAGLLEFQIEKAFISILWMFPQYFILCMGEILIYTANLNFSYTEAPTSMKSVMIGFSYLTVAGGCLIVILISGVAFFDSQAYEFLFFAGITFVDVLIYGFLATRYKYVSRTS